MDLKESTKKYLLDSMISAVDPPSGWKILIVDEEGMRILSAALKMYDIIERGVTVVEPLHQARQRIPELEAIYFLEPSKKSIQRLVEDFSDASKPMYAKVHLFLTAALDDDGMGLLKSQPALVSRISTLQELYVDFIAYEQRSFHLNRPHALRTLFAPESSGSEECAIIAERLFCLCVTMNDAPQIRFAATHPVAGRLAAMVSDRLRAYRKTNKAWKPNSGAQQATLLILDRSHDPAAPLLHEFTYQAMVYDMLSAVVKPHVEFRLASEISAAMLGQKKESGDGAAEDDLEAATMSAAKRSGAGAGGGQDSGDGDGSPAVADCYRYTVRTDKGKMSTKTVLLGEHDSLWVRLRHEHIADAINVVLQEMRKFLQANKAARFAGAKADKKAKTGFAELSQALKAMPAYKKSLGNYELHVQIADACMKAFNAQSMLDVASVEQGLATGETSDGKPFKSSTAAIAPLLRNPDISQENKLRLLMLFFITQIDVDEKTRRKLIDGADLTASQQQAIANLQYIGVSLQRAPVVAGSKRKDKRKKKTPSTDDVPYEISRFQPALRAVLTKLIDDTLDEQMYPIADPGGAGVTSGGGGGKSKKSGGGTGSSLRSSTPKWNKSKGDKRKGTTGSASSAGGRFIVFIAGGMSFSEIRTTYEVAEKTKRNVLIGGTSLLTPQGMIDELTSLNE